MLSGTLVLAVLILSIGSSAHAADFLLCATINKKTGDVKEGASIRLRSACKRQEVAIGSTDELEAVRAHTVFSEIGLELSDIGNDSRSLVEQFRRERNHVTARLSEIYATTTAGENVVLADGDLALTSIDDMIAAVVVLSDSLTPFDEGTIVSSDAVFAPKVVTAATAINSWIADAQSVAQNMIIRLELTKARLLLSQNPGDPVPVGSYLLEVASNLEDLRDQLERPFTTAEPGLDVNALVQHVLRESYLETTRDLLFFAEKVKFFNQLKQDIRNELMKTRDTLQSISACSQFLHERSMEILRKVGDAADP